ncbi:LysR family transcriptional regulator [Streptomyces sp. NPDC056480]|uniref:LysR family transcriptional regulator n=1 Tax=Streptomyces sp. NPDC056480 TaxID=3345833 RepID=UPI0036ACE30A
MEIFLTLAEELHFGRTAERLHVSNALVSQTLKTLERRLGVALFDRTSRRVALTDAGRRFRDDLDPLYQGIREAVDRVMAASGDVTGLLRVGFEGHRAGMVVQAASEVYRARHPGTRVDAREVQLFHQRDLLREGELDLQITLLPVRDPDITVGPIVSSAPLYLITAVGHRLADRESVVLDDLAGETWFSPSEEVPDYVTDYYFPRRTPSGKTIRRSTQRGRTFTELITMVAMGRAVGGGSGNELLHYYARSDVAFIPITDAPAVSHALMWVTGREDSRIRAFCEVVSEVAPKVP